MTLSQLKALSPFCATLVEMFGKSIPVGHAERLAGQHSTSLADLPELAAKDGRIATVDFVLALGY